MLLLRSLQQQLCDRHILKEIFRPVVSYVKVVWPTKLCAKHATEHAKHGAARGGSGGMPPQEILKN